MKPVWFQSDLMTHFNGGDGLKMSAAGHYAQHPQGTHWKASEDSWVIHGAMGASGIVRAGFP